MDFKRFLPVTTSRLLVLAASLAASSAAAAGSIAIAVSPAINVDPGGCSYEPRQLMTVFTPLGGTIAYLPDISAGSIVAQLNAGNLVVIPDQEVGSILTVWGADAALVRQAVLAGGNMLVFGSDNLNDTALLNVLISGGSTGPLVDRSAAPGPFVKSPTAPAAFAATASNLIWQDGTYSIEGWNAADVIYASGSVAAVACRNVGLGRVGFVAYDFFCPTGSAASADWTVVAQAMAGHTRGSADCNGNGIADATDLANHIASDCNGNGTLDSCEIASGAALDLDADGFPDSCQSDVVIWGADFVGQSTVPANLGRVRSIAAGYYHTAVALANGTVRCWGWNNYGQCSVPPGLSNVAEVASQGWHTVTRRADGTVACWGRNDQGECNVPGDLGPVAKISGGDGHTVVLLANGTVRCWGRNGNGQCNVPVGLVPASWIGASGFRSAAVSASGSAFAWGLNDYGQCNVPTGLSQVVEIAASPFHTMARRSDGTVVCWGANDLGACNVPSDLGSVAHIAVGGWHSIALKSDGTVRCWGRNHVGQLDVPAGLDRVVDVKGGNDHTVALRALVAPPTAALLSTTSTTCSLSNGAINVTVTNAPILSWTGPSGFASTAEDLTNLAPGTYTLTARGPGGTTTLSVTVTATPDTTAPVITSYTASASAAASQNCTAAVPNFTSSVVANDDCTIASITQSPLAGASVGLGANTVTIRVTDAAGNFTTRVATFTVTGSSATYYADADSDGYGAGAATISCAAIAGKVTNNTDCNDANAAVHPGAIEVCNGIDDDCVGGADNGLAFNNYYTDADHDGYGAVGASAQSACAQPTGSAPNNTDCNDANAGVHPNAAEVCGDGLDNNCVWGVDEGCAPFTVFMAGPASPPVPGNPFIVRVSCNAAGSVLTGEQLAVHFDAARLALADVVPVAGSPFTLVIAKQIDNAAGTLRYAAGIPGGGQGLASEANLVDLVFTVRAGASMCGDAVLATFEPVGSFVTRFSRPGASSLVPAAANLPLAHLDTTPPVLAGLPSDVAVPTDAGSTYGAFVSLPTVTATDDCDGAVAVVATGIPANGVFPIGSTTVTWTAVDAAGNSVSASRTVTVEPYQLLDLTVCVDGAFTGNSTRQIRVTVGAASSVVSVPFTQTCGSVSAYHVPVSASLACVTAKDTAHSISGHAAASIVGTRYSASVSLRQGDSNDDDMVDIVDFGLLVDDFGGPRTREARSNFNADLVVNNGDFSFISVNFFQVGDPCVAAANPLHPRDRVSVKQLRREGLGRLESADINRDGWVDTVDVQMFLQGRRGGGAPQRADIPRESGSVAW